MAYSKIGSSYQDSSALDLKTRFLNAALRIHDLGKSVGLVIVPATSPALPLFSKLDHTKQVSAVDAIETAVCIFDEVAEAKKSLTDSNSVVWSALKKFGWKPTSDFFSYVGSTDMIEIFSAEGIHRFANLKFFELCSYTLEQIYTQPWDTLFYREPSAMQDLHEAVVGTLTSPEKKTRPYNKPAHNILEIASPFKLEFSYKLKFISPLTARDSADVTGFITIEEGFAIRQQPHNDEKMRLMHEFEMGAPGPHLSLV